MNLQWISGRITKVRDCFQAYIDDFCIRKKLLILYIFCVLIPLILTDNFIIYVSFHSVWMGKQHSMENIANAVWHNFAQYIENADQMAQNLYINRSLNEFLSRQYKDVPEYVKAYYEYFQKSIFDAGMIINNIGITFYTDNATIVNGGRCNSIESISESDWYKELESSDQESILFFWYDDSHSPAVEAKRKIIFARKMDFYDYNNSCKKILVLTLNYGTMAADLKKMNYGMPVYICNGDTLLLSNQNNSIRENFVMNEQLKRNAYIQEKQFFGRNFSVCIEPAKISILEEIKKNALIIVLLLIANIVLPFLLVREINRSFSVRIGKLSDVFNRIEEEKLIEIEETGGKDEIGELMCNYNRMVRRVNLLIQTIYIAKMKEQEMVVARQNAELLALHSQINPHFLFNALESIRMHSILKKEFETAEMVKRLALLQRQCLEWGNDFIDIQEEMEFVDTYLRLQKYRFGERLNYRLDIEEDCKTYKIPKLTIVTFVENACVHGVESKLKPGWIFVRVYRQNNSLYLEVEDTGRGMDENTMRELQYHMESASIEMLQDRGRVGIINACLRLKMMVQNDVSFSVDGERGMGTIIQIKISPGSSQDMNKCTDIVREDV